MGAPPGGMPQAVASPPAPKSGFNFSTLLGWGFGLIMALVIGGTIVAQNVLGYQVPIVGRFIGGGGRSSKGSSPAKREFSKLGLDQKAVDPMALIAISGKKARRWRKDAVFYSISINGMKTDGTVDFTDKGSNATVEFFSPALVGSTSSTKRKEGIRKYLFNKWQVKEEIWGVKKRYTGMTGTPEPKCPAKTIGKLFADRGVSKTNTFLVSLDPGFAFATDSLSLNCQTSKGKKVHVYLHIDSCKVLKEF